MKNSICNKPINIKEICNQISDLWAPKIIAQFNDNHIKLVCIKGDFTWHAHKDTDEVFILIEGEMRIDFRDNYVLLKKGELYVIPKGIEHKPYSENESKLLLIESKGTINTGNAGGIQTAEDGIWI